MTTRRAEVMRHESRTARALLQPLLAVGLLMTLAAGYVDAVGYVRLGQLYLSFMSGNSAQWGMALAAGNRQTIAWGGTVIAIFVFGCFFGALIAAAAGQSRLMAVLSCELLCLAASLTLTVLSVGRAALLPIALAMGIQNAAHQIIHGSDTGRTFITGTLVSAGQALAHVVLGQGGRAVAALSLTSWSAFTLGVFLGAVSLANLGQVVALMMATATLVILVLMAWRIGPPVALGAAGDTGR